MTQSGDTVPQLEELEPLEDTTAGPAGPPVTPVMIAGGLPAPAYNIVADKEYYRFLFAGVVLLIGCLMPYGPNWDMAGYKTLRGGVILVIALGIVWSSWASIHNRRMVKGLLRWVFLAFLPLLLGIVDLIYAFDPSSAVGMYIDQVGAENAVDSWGDLFGQLRGALTPGDQIGEFFHHYGTGRLFTFFGALLCEGYMLLAIFGGAKKIKEQKAERRAAAGTARRR